MVKKSFGLFILILICLLGFSCNPDSGELIIPLKIRLSLTFPEGSNHIGEEMDIKNMPSFYTGEILYLDASVYPINSSNKKLKFSSSNPAVAKVDKKGKTVLVGPGRTKITIESVLGGKTKSFDINVYDRITELSIDTNEFVDLDSRVIERTVEDVLNFSTIYSPSTSVNRKFRYRVENPELFSIDKNTGNMICSTPGTTRVAVMPEECYLYYDFDFSNPDKFGHPFEMCTLVIHPIHIETISFDFDYKLIESEDSFRLIPNIVPSNATDQRITWSSTNPSAAQVNTTGLVTGMRPGGAVIQAITNDGNIVASCEVRVYYPSLVFSSPNPFAITKDGGKTWNGKLFYSYDQYSLDWTEWNGEVIYSELLENDEDEGEEGSINTLCIRGEGNSVITGNIGDINGNKLRILNSDVYCSGDIASLLDCLHRSNVVMDPYCFRGLFFNDYEAIRYTLLSAPTLNINVLSDSCYRDMFRGCNKLTVCPDLPARYLADNCYYEMFLKCSSITKTPKLEAMNLKPSCYRSMFYGCTSLTETFGLPAIALPEYCYYQMFTKCSSLVNPPIISAMSVGSHSCARMFKECTSLAQPPVLLSTKIDDYGYWDMFNSCTSLVSTPELPCLSLSEHCYDNMFYNCISLKTVTRLVSDRLAPYCYYSMFENCNHLETIPLLHATDLFEGCYNRMFFNCCDRNDNYTGIGVFGKSSELGKYPYTVFGIYPDENPDDKTTSPFYQMFESCNCIEDFFTPAPNVVYMVNVRTI